MWALPGLNTRETAIAIWLSLLLGFLLTKRDVRSSFASTGRVLFGSAFLAGMLAAATAYATALVLVVRHFVTWDAELTKLSAFWFFGVALVAAFDTKDVSANYYRRLLLRTLTLAALLEFVGNLHTFPLPVELLLVPFVFLSVGVVAVADARADYASAKRTTEWVLALAGLASLAFSTDYLVSHFHQVATTDKVVALLLPALLTCAFVPFLVGLRLVVLYQTILHMTRAGLPNDAELYRATRRGILKECGFNLSRLQGFENRFAAGCGAWSHSPTWTPCSPTSAQPRS